MRRKEAGRLGYSYLGEKGSADSFFTRGKPTADSKHDGTEPVVNDLSNRDVRFSRVLNRRARDLIGE